MGDAVDDLAVRSEATSSSATPKIRRAIGWALVAYWAALFTGTHIPLPQLKEMPRFSDKVMHFGAYAGLAFLLGLWISAKRGFVSRLPWKVLLVTSLYGIADELLQIPVHRSAEVADWFADVLGGMFGLVSLAAVRDHLKRFFASAAHPKGNKR